MALNPFANTDADGLLTRSIDNTVQDPVATKKCGGYKLATRITLNGTFASNGCQNGDGIVAQLVIRDRQIKTCPGANQGELGQPLNPTEWYRETQAYIEFWGTAISVAGVPTVEVANGNNFVRDEIKERSFPDTKRGRTEWRGISRAYCLSAQLQRQMQALITTGGGVPDGIQQPNLPMTTKYRYWVVYLNSVGSFDGPLDTTVSSYYPIPNGAGPAGGVDCCGGNFAYTGWKTNFGSSYDGP
jgi:hypothetical protein